MAKHRMLCVLFGVLTLCLVATASPVSETPVATADSTENSSEELNGIFKEVEEMCRNNSATDAAYKHVLASFGQTIMCGASTINLNQLVLDAGTLNNETRKTFFPRYCPQLRNGYSCIQSLVEDFEPCVDEDDYTIVRALVDIVPDALKLLCKNDGEVLFKYEEPKYDECIEQLRDSFDQCTQGFLNGTDIWDISHLTKGQCNIMTGFRQCLQNQMSICKVPDLISVYDLFHNALIRMTPCRDFLTLQKVEVIDDNTIDKN